MRKVWIFGALSLIVAGCNNSGTNQSHSSAGVTDPNLINVSLTKGQPVELMLAKRLDAGSCKEGDYVPLIVAEDVKDATGTVGIPKGTVVDGEVAWSRSEGTLSGMVGQPARLEIRVKGAKLDEAHTIPLCASVEDPEKAYAFTRDNTGLPGSETIQLDAILKDEAKRQALEQLNKAMSGEEVALESTETQMAIQRIAQELNLSETQKLVESSGSSWIGLSSSLKDLQKGNLLSIAGGEGTLAVGAAMELINLAGQVGGQITDKLKGRTIRAFPGTRVTVYLVADQKIGILGKK